MMKKSDRQKVFDKFEGKCAYSGLPLQDDWQIDHITHKKSIEWLLLEAKGEKYDIDHIDNLFPCIKILNHYKRGLDLEPWREYLKILHIKLAKLAKNPRSSKGIKYKKYMLSVASCFNISPKTPFNGIFYFETLNNDRNTETSR